MDGKKTGYPFFPFFPPCPRDHSHVSDQAEKIGKKPRHRTARAHKDRPDANPHIIKRTKSGARGRRRKSAGEACSYAGRLRMGREIVGDGLVLAQIHWSWAWDRKRFRHCGMAVTCVWVVSIDVCVCVCMCASQGQETFFWTSAKTMGGGWRTSRRVWP
ncbi:uncharacterized protein GLRG_09273 [Colletotrichum graminicola M1.001]|uniref:Uncharacterized protein n=1 Tax=Colletotrichum graminicola (strain M1.001 / M2 / FGSC 10212) TaxID=645133 RepID=E3QTE1_COLGM|nr:uncharacterized protein GLRG_09273 [Colletotrichum graminicola M1.001]EFQ34129.1 hypothetical protein GLRG_09273 [Colletotrichum graminicola M1.001]